MASRYRLDPIEIVTLRHVRSLIASSSARGGVLFFALLYALGSAFSSGMILIARLGGSYTVTWLWGSGNGTEFWNYPGLLVVAPWGFIEAPFFPTLAMIVVAIGVGYGMTVAFLLTARLLKNRSREAGGATATSAVAGLTPAMITLVTLGACCSTTAAASAGVGLVAVAAGTTTNNLLLNNWFLGVFQIAIVWVALLAQELLLIVYAGLFDPSARPGSGAAAATPRLTGRSVAIGTARALVLVGAVLWSLSMVAEWTTVSPATASAGLWFQWIVEHQVVAGVAIAVALFPTGTLALLDRLSRPANLAVRGLVLVGAGAMLWSPPPFAAWGLDGFVNQVLFVVGAPAAWGPLSPDGLAGAALLFRWGIEYLLLAGVGIGFAVRPDRWIGRLAVGRGWSVPEGRTCPAPSESGPAPPAGASSVPPSP